MASDGVPDVPKFSSFKPKQKPDTTKSRADESPHHERRRPHGRPRSRPPPKHRSLHYRTRSPPEPMEAAVSLAARDAELFTVDIKGDPANVNYGTLYKPSTPTYRRAGNGGIFGAPDLRIDRDNSTEYYTTLLDDGKCFSARMRPILSQSVKRTDHLRLIRFNQLDTIDPDQEYVPIQNRKRKLGEEASKLEEEQDYRAPITKDTSDEQQPEDPETRYDSDESDEGESIAAEARRRNTELMLSTELDPSNVKVWRDLVDHQEWLFRAESSNLTQCLAIEEEETLTKIKIGLWQTALKHCPKEAHQEIVLELLKEDEMTTDPEAREKKFQRAIEKNPKFFGFQLQYAEWLQHECSIFEYEKTRQQWIKTIEVSEDPIDCLYAFLRLTAMMRDAGYIEHAIGIWQAILECHFNPLDKENFDIEDFEEFWDREHPRIGERGSRGWRWYLKNDDTRPRDPYLSPMPARSSDETEDDDPFRIVLFSDIADVIVAMTPAVLTPKIALVQAFLCFCGLPPLADDAVDPQYWWLDQHLRTGPADAIQYQQHTAWSLFLKGTFPATDSATLPIEVIDNALDHMQFHRGSCVGKGIVSEYLLAFLHHYNPTNVTRAAKAIIKANSSSLRLYNAYALALFHQGKFDAALNILAKAMTLPDNGDAILLRHTTVQIALDIDNPTMALSLILGIGIPPTATYIQDSMLPTDLDELLSNISAVLRASQALRDYQEHAISICSPHVALATDLLALLAYFRAGKDLEIGLEVYARLPTLVISKTTRIIELCHQSRASFCLWHVSTTRQYRPEAIQTVLAASVHEFPNNSFLREAKGRFEGDRVRAMIREHLYHPWERSRPKSTVISCSSRIAAESARYARGAGSKAAIVAAYRHAVYSDGGKWSVALWRGYVRYLLDSGEGKKALAAFHEAVQEMPWAGSFMLWGRDELRAVMREERYEMVGEMVEERGLRM